MAATAKHNRLERTNATDASVGSSQKFYCCRCGTAYSRRKGFFPVSHSPMYRGSGYLPMCSECVEEMYEDYRRKFAGDDREALKRICMKLDLYWSDSIYKMVEKTAGVNSRVRNYIGKTNIVRYIDKTYDDTVEEELRAAAAADRESAPQDGQPPAPSPRSGREEADDGREEDDGFMSDAAAFWGKGFSRDFYEELARRYEEWTGGAEVPDQTERALYKQICMLEVTISRDTAAGRSTEKNINTLNSLLGSMNLKPTQKKAADDASADDGTPFGVWIRKWENESPVPEPDPDFADADGIVRYISIWFLGHLCKMLGIRNTYCRLYEEEMKKMRIERPEYEDEDDDEAVFSGIFGHGASEEEEAGEA